LGENGRKTKKATPSLRIVRHPRHQRPGPQQGEVRARRLGAKFPGSPHLRSRRSPPPGERPAAFFYTNSRQRWVRTTHINMYGKLLGDIKPEKRI